MSEEFFPVTTPETGVVETEPTEPVQVVPEEAVSHVETAPTVAEVVVEPDPITIQETARQHAERLQHEEDERRKEAFMEQIAEARKPAPPPPPPQPSNPAVLAQTEREMAEGRRQNAIHAAAQVHRPRPQKSAAELAAEGKSTSVFRPHTYTHEQGNVQGKNLSTGDMPVH